jgi:hypothetical protein
MIEESAIAGSVSDGQMMTSSEQKHRASIPNNISIPSNTSYNNNSPHLINGVA